MASLEDLFGSFGAQVVEMLRAEIEQNGDLSRILTKLNVAVPAAPSAQQEAVRAFLFQFGVGFFFVIMKSNWSAGELESQKAQRIAATVRPSAIGDIAPAKGKAPSSAASIQQPAAPPQPTIVYVTAPAPPQAPVSIPPAPPEPPPQEVAWVDSPEYKGPERRSGVERRVGPADRRTQLEAVNRNRRYGGKDRRKIIRRACDRERLGKKS